jgi:hypothetical protein
MKVSKFIPCRLWRTAQVFTQSFDGKWLLHNRMVTVRPGETKEECLKREGFSIKALLECDERKFK